MSCDYKKIKDLTEKLEETIGLDIVKNNGGSLLTQTTADEFIKILTIPEFQYNPQTKRYNNKLLTAATLQKKYNEIKKS